jgi:DNA repair exonuclease SbcCD ATPase subunit
MTFTIILLTISICLIFYFILNDKISKVKKEYVKNDLVSEMKDIISAFNEEADRNISILEDKIKQIDTKIKKLEKIKKSLEHYNLNEINIKDLEEEKEENKEKVDEKLDLNWQETAYKMFSNGFSVDEIAQKLGKLSGEVQFAISYYEMIKRIVK